MTKELTNILYAVSVEKDAQIAFYKANRLYPARMRVCTIVKHPYLIYLEGDYTVLGECTEDEITFNVLPFLEYKSNKFYKDFTNKDNLIINK